MEDTDQRLLDVSVSPAGAAAIRQLIGVTRWLFILGIVFSCLTLINACMEAVIYGPTRYTRSLPALYLSQKVQPWSIVLLITLSLAGLYFYLRFVRQINRGLQTLDNEQFNTSFAWIYRWNVISIVQLTLSLLLAALHLWMYIEWMHRRN